MSIHFELVFLAGGQDQNTIVQHSVTPHSIIIQDTGRLSSKKDLAESLFPSEAQFKKKQQQGIHVCDEFMFSLILREPDLFYEGPVIPLPFKVRWNWRSARER